MAEGKNHREDIMNSSNTSDSMIHARALEWLVELEDQHTDALKLRSFAQWFLESTLHQDAFVEALAISAFSRRFDPGRRFDVERLLTTPDDNVVPFKGESSPRSEPEQPLIPIRPCRRFPAAICASLLVLLGIPLVISSLRVLPDLFAGVVNYSAGIGERRFVPLEDGSTVELNTRSSIEVEMNSHVRQITLLSGEAVFTVRHDAGCPFRVISGGIVIRDVGTTFDVQQQANGGASISVLEGRVEISTRVPSPAVQTALSPMILEADHVADVMPFGDHIDVRIRAVAAPELARQLAWRDGHLVFEGETLTEVVAKLNRYNRRQMKIVDQSIARKSIGGTFTTTDFDAFLDTIKQLFDIQAAPARENSNVTELRRRQASQ